MPNCRKCGSYFPSRITIDGESKVLNSRKYCLDCSPYKSKNTRRLEQASAAVCGKEDLPGSKVCLLCERDLPRSNFGIYQKKGKWTIYSYCKKCDSERAKKFSLECKRRAVEYKGGKCMICGYSKSLRALEFHHVNDDKETNVSSFRIRDWDLLKVELDKCSLLCANCHREEHERIDNG